LPDSITWTSAELISDGAPSPGAAEPDTPSVARLAPTLQLMQSAPLLSDRPSPLGPAPMADPARAAQTERWSGSTTSLPTPVGHVDARSTSGQQVPASADAGLATPASPPPPSAASEPRVLHVARQVVPSHPGQAAVRAGIAHHDADGSVVFSTAPSFTGQSATPSPTPSPSPEPQPTPAVQRASDPGGPPPASAVAPAVSAGPGSPAPVPANVDLEELTRRLFEPLTARLKTELRLDRERAGAITDLRR
jgi:hypothetical protein